MGKYKRGLELVALILEIARLSPNQHRGPQQPSQEVARGEGR